MDMLVRCDRCGGDIVVAELRAEGRPVRLVARLTAGETPIEARVCVECGYAAFFATAPHLLHPRPGQHAQGGAA